MSSLASPSIPSRDSLQFSEGEGETASAESEYCVYLTNLNHK